VEWKSVFRGTYAAKIDEKGRLKIPNALRSVLEKEHGTELFVTSLTGEYVRLYPMPVWLAHEQKLAQLPSEHPSLVRYLERVNYWGQPAEIDTQGRVVIHSRLREAAGIAGDVDVSGHADRLELWNHERFQQKMQREPYTEDDARALAALGI
jgi:MraZ protein